MSDVIKFPEKADPHTVWVCGCGCSTWYLNGEKSATCAHCGRPADNPDVVARGWGTLPPPPKPFEPPELEGNDPVVVDFNASGQSFEHMKSHLDDYRKFSVIILIKNTGGLHTWGKIETQAEREWFERRIQVARGLLFEGEAAVEETNHALD